MSHLYPGHTPDPLPGPRYEQPIVQVREVAVSVVVWFLGCAVAVLLLRGVDVVIAAAGWARP